MKKEEKSLTLREINIKYLIPIGGGYLLIHADYADFIRAIHKWSRDRNKKAV